LGEEMMRWFGQYSAGTLVLLLVLGCARGPSEEKDMLTTVNAYQITVSEFERLFAEDAQTDPEMTVTAQAKRDYLNEIIQKQILIQEAKRLQFDQKPKFIRTIERYWESTLIRDLMESKSQEIAARIVVTQEETQRVYDEMKKNNPELAPLTEIEVKLTAKIKEEKKTAMFQKWIEALKQQAKIQVNEKAMGDL
jgi:peptidyl-prolyl cis-trans isomerase C